MSSKQQIAQLAYSRKGWLIITTLLLVWMVAFSEHHRQNRKVTEAIIHVEESPHQNLVALTELQQLINREFVKSTRNPGFTSQEVEALVCENPFVANTKVYTTLQGALQISLAPQEPVLRIINQDNQSFYINRKGEKFDLSESYTAHVLVATGAIEEQAHPTDSLKTHTAEQLYHTALAIENDAFFKSLIGQIHVEQNGGITLITKSLHSHHILLANTDRLQMKLRKLKNFYQKVLADKGWNTYSHINLQFHQQIVAK